MTEKKKPRGFAALSPTKRREIASMGGRAAHEKGLAYQFTSETARAAAKKSWRKRQAEKFEFLTT